MPTPHPPWWKPPQLAGPDSGLATLLHWVSLIVGVLTVLVGVGTVATIGTDLKHVSANIIVVVMTVGVQALLRSGHARVAAQSFVFVLWAIISVWLFRAGGTSSPIVATYFSVIATTSVLLSRRMGLVYALLSAAVLGVLFIAENAGYSSMNPYTPALRYVVIAAALVMTGGVIYFAARLKEEASARALASERQFEELVRTAPEAILTVDGGGVIRSVNPSAESLFQRTDLVGALLDGLPGLAGVREDGARARVIERPDATRREVEVDVRQLASLGEGATCVSVRDVTAQRVAERDRARLAEQLKEMQKQESIGLLAGGIAHDFNNLVTVSLANLELLKLSVNDEANLALVDEAEKASHRAAALTRQLLAFGRRQVLHARNVSLNTVVEDLRPMLRRLVTENIEMRFSLDAKGIVRADAGQLEQVIVNLALNARDAMPNGGVLSFITADVELAETVAAPAGRFVSLRVEDTGLGMPPHVLARAFEPFFTTKELGRGTGLGLSVVEGVVRQSGGTVSVQSTEGKGTRFEILLPRVEAQAADRAESSHLAAPLDGGGRTVLVIEDEAPLRRVVAHVLESAGFKVLVSGDGEEALTVAAGASTIDLVVSDVVMPRLGGPETVRRLRERHPGLKALFMSGYTDRPLEELGAASRDSAFIGKPFRPNELVTAALELLARQCA